MFVWYNALFFEKKKRNKRNTLNSKCNANNTAESGYGIYKYGLYHHNSLRLMTFID